MKKKLIYIGKRFEHGKLFHAFSDGKTEFLYIGIKFALIGQYYEGEKKGEHISLSKMPKTVDGPEVAEKDIEQWHALSIAADQTMKRKRLSKKIETVEMKRIIEKIRDLYGDLDFSEKRQLLEYILNQVSKGSIKSKRN